MITNRREESTLEKRTRWSSRWRRGIRKYREKKRAEWRTRANSKGEEKKKGRADDGKRTGEMCPCVMVAALSAFICR